MSIERIGGLYGKTSIIDGDLARFSILPKLRSLSLGACPVGDEGVGHLASVTTLRLLFIDGTGIADEGLRLIAGLKNLQELRVNGTKITDQGLIHLKELSQLKTLLLGRTQVTEAGVEELAKALPNCRIQFTTGGEYKTIGPIGVATSPFDDLRREDIDPYELSVSGDGDPNNVPAELVAIYGDSRLAHRTAPRQLAFDATGELVIIRCRDTQVVCLPPRWKAVGHREHIGRDLLA